jgi:dethiobiotin synthetase
MTTDDTAHPGLTLRPEPPPAPAFPLPPVPGVAQPTATALTLRPAAPVSPASDPSSRASAPPSQRSAPSAEETAPPVEPLPAEPEPSPAEPEPTQPEPTRPEPTQPEPAEPEPTRPEPTRPEPAQPEPAQPEPAQPEPAQPEPAEPEPAETMPTPVEPVGPEAVPLDAPVSPAPVSPAPVGGDLATTVLPDGDALGDEVAAELSAQAAPQRPDHGEWRGIVLVTGTDTDVGKTIVTAAVAAAAQSSGLRIAVIKPGQTGTATGAPTDIEVVTRLAAPDTTRVLAEYPEPMAPLAAATVAQLPPLELYAVVDAIRAEADKHDLVLVEGAGGLLVPMGVRPSGEAWTLADLAIALGVKTIVVARAGLGTLNHTALTLEALSRRGVPAGVVIGAWPPDPELVHWANLSELLPHLMGALPDGAGQMDPGVFRRSAPGWLTPPLYGVIDNWRVWAEETDGH